VFFNLVCQFFFVLTAEGRWIDCWISLGWYFCWEKHGGIWGWWKSNRMKEILPDGVLLSREHLHSEPWVLEPDANLCLIGFWRNANALIKKKRSNKKKDTLCWYFLRLDFCTEEVDCSTGIVFAVPYETPMVANYWSETGCRRVFSVDPLVFVIFSGNFCVSLLLWCHFSF